MSTTDPHTVEEIDWQSVTEDAQQLLAASDCVHSRAEVDAALDRMADEVHAIYGDRPLHVLAVMNGALFPCAALLQRLRNPMVVDYLHATRYRGQTSGGNLVWKVAPPPDLRDRDVLLVDDILDEGKTLQAIREALGRSGPASLRVAVLVRKVHDRCVAGAGADIIGLEVPDRYVFGCGMDVHGFWRQLPEIRALREG